MKEKYIRLGNRVTNYMSVNTHPGAIVRFRPDAINNKTMQEQGMISEPFEEKRDAFVVCSDPHCEGNFFYAERPSEWSDHVRLAHKARSPFGRMSRLNEELTAKTSLLDQAVAAEREAKEKREKLEAEAAALKAELEPANAPEPLPAAGSAKSRTKAR